MHAQGNDYVYFDLRVISLRVDDLSCFARDISARRYGVGGDGIVLILPPEQGGDARMRIFNRDGSEARMCGSALRCVIGYLAESDKDVLKIETESGFRTGRLCNLESRIVAADMGNAGFREEDAVALGAYAGWVVDTGNTHFVIFGPVMELESVFRDGAMLEKHEYFPAGANIHFVHIASPDALEIQTWERGSGFTHACGTGATAAVFAAIHKRGMTSPLRVTSEGGTVEVSVDESGRCELRGRVDLIYRGILENAVQTGKTGKGF